MYMHRIKMANQGQWDLMCKHQRNKQNHPGSEWALQEPQEEQGYSHLPWPWLLCHPLLRAVPNSLPFQWVIGKTRQENILLAPDRDPSTWSRVLWSESISLVPCFIFTVAKKTLCIHPSKQSKSLHQDHFPIKSLQKIWQLVLEMVPERKKLRTFLQGLRASTPARPQVPTWFWTKHGLRHMFLPPGRRERVL